jgi:tetratricopeptide (TPR) repeat protein
MEFTFNTQIVDVSVALNALNLYREGNYKQAISHLTDILDMEPNNWQARLMLGACHYQVGEYSTSQRVFRFLADYCTDQEVKRKALSGFQAASAKLAKPLDLPPEFGCYADLKPAQRKVTWLDEMPAERSGASPAPKTQTSTITLPKYKW